MVEISTSIASYANPEIIDLSIISFTMILQLTTVWKYIKPYGKWLYEQNDRWAYIHGMNTCGTYEHTTFLEIKSLIGRQISRIENSAIIFVCS